jgi:hypothetical protein
MPGAHEGARGRGAAGPRRRGGPRREWITIRPEPHRLRPARQQHRTSGVSTTATRPTCATTAGVKPSWFWLVTITAVAALAWRAASSCPSSSP